MNYFKQICLEGPSEGVFPPYNKEEIVRIAIRGRLDFDSLQKIDKRECFIEQKFSYRHHFCAKVKDILFSEKCDVIYIVFQINDLYFFTYISKAYHKDSKGWASEYLDKIKSNLSKLEKGAYIEGLVELGVNENDGEPCIYYDFMGYTLPFDLTYLFQAFRIKKIMDSEWQQDQMISTETKELLLTEGTSWLMYVELLEPRETATVYDELPYQPKRLPLTEADLYCFPSSPPSPLNH